MQHMFGAIAFAAGLYNGANPGVCWRLCNATALHSVFEQHAPLGKNTPPPHSLNDEWCGTAPNHRRTDRSYTR